MLYELLYFMVRLMSLRFLLSINFFAMDSLLVTLDSSCSFFLIYSYHVIGTDLLHGDATLYVGIDPHAEITRTFTYTEMVS